MPTGKGSTSARRVAGQAVPGELGCVGLHPLEPGDPRDEAACLRRARASSRCSCEGGVRVLPLQAVDADVV